MIDWDNEEYEEDEDEDDEPSAFEEAMENFAAGLLNHFGPQVGAAVAAKAGEVLRGVAGKVSERTGIQLCPHFPLSPFEEAAYPAPEALQCDCCKRWVHRYPPFRVSPGQGPTSPPYRCTSCRAVEAKGVK